MLLVPKSSFLEEYKSELAATRNDWTLTKVGREEIYLLPESRTAGSPAERVHGAGQV